MVSEEGLYAADEEIWCQKKDYMRQRRHMVSEERLTAADDDK